MFVVGDSRAEMLGFGLDHLQRDSVFGVDSAVGCANAPYFLEGSYGNEQVCDTARLRQTFLSFAVDQIGRTKPDIVILHARWTCDLDITQMEQAVEKLRETASQIQQASPASRIVILRPVPEWPGTTARAIYRAWLVSLGSANHRRGAPARRNEPTRSGRRNSAFPAIGSDA
jgi:hypothetical protein